MRKMLLTARWAYELMMFLRVKILSLLSRSYLAVRKGLSSSDSSGAMGGQPEVAGRL